MLPRVRGTVNGPPAAKRLRLILDKHRREAAPRAGKQARVRGRMVPRKGEMTGPRDTTMLGVMGRYDRLYEYQALSASKNTSHRSCNTGGGPGLERGAGVTGARLRGVTALTWVGAVLNLRLPTGRHWSTDALLLPEELGAARPGEAGAPSAP
ncbi:hypothetical protein NDU88_006726 [Pleurodeles waltl]|uniref:Uncharacterized protein n=1 Tax=Pleurodeles waltl TaxID=8319 RepID=A0AAV7PLS2_PLEWA|nr:hypothetical protein NDU88_006726 [Pleurodeles waltl]